MSKNDMKNPQTEKRADNKNTPVERERNKDEHGQSARDKSSERQWRQ